MFCDKRHIIRVFDNIINNSIDFIPKDTGTIYIDISKITKMNNQIYTHIEITDNGPGICEKSLDQLFTLFGKSLSCDTEITRARSTGLGLYSCKKIIEAHKGYIWYDQTYKDGAKFIFELPDSPNNE